MAISAAIAAAATTIGGAVVSNQQKQKAKGQASQIERDSQAAQAAADAKLQQQHDESIQEQSQAGAILRKKLEKPLAPSPRSATLLTPQAPLAPAPPKTLLGQ